MNRIRKKSKLTTEVSMSSLPDIVFLLLFFFMVSTVINKNEEKVKTDVPIAYQLTKPNKKILIREMIIGFPIDTTLGNEPIISVNKRFIKLDHIPLWVEQEKSTLPEPMRNQIIVLIRADRMVKMGLIADVQQLLRRSNARKVLYRSNSPDIEVL